MPLHPEHQGKSPPSKPAPIATTRIWPADVCRTECSAWQESRLAPGRVTKQTAICSFVEADSSNSSMDGLTFAWPSGLRKHTCAVARQPSASLRFPGAIAVISRVLSSGQGRRRPSASHLCLPGITPTATGPASRSGRRYQRRLCACPFKERVCGDGGSVRHASGRKPAT